ncbi:Helix-hairpin-helix motif-containing protein [Granulicella pectinivorans]|uniref:Helix-hairpin-helix motif-containing protein n=1 Tax=Granulicella pectinivorans TaxID=474950 RepID=A0A1I6L6D9_9BACT|nr:helix-hairpin-helix domain-containing protein [Granulicella pectinivorans]SFR99055.1 Helix-hairpin-helix motif-containing protein [Granulicella pectinivorans]
MLHLRRRLLSAALLFALAPAFAFQSTLARAQAKPSAAAPAAAPRPVADSAKLDINTATVAQLKALPGVGDVYSQKIVAGRPYANKTQLTSKGILPQKTYDGIKDAIIAKQPAKK